MRRAFDEDDSLDGWTFIPAFPKQHGTHRAPLPIPVSAKVAGRSIHVGSQLQLGGLQVPTPKSRTRSIGSVLHGPLPVDSTDFDHALKTVPGLQRDSTMISVGRGRQLKPTSRQKQTSSDLLRIQCPSKSTWLVQEWQSILHDLGSLSSVFQALEHSAFSRDHAARLLDQFAPSTLLRYFSAWRGFFPHGTKPGLVDGKLHRGATCRCPHINFIGKEVRLFCRHPFVYQGCALDVNTRGCQLPEDCLGPAH